jgi:hypothetical protein
VAQRYCTNCGAELGGENRFCPNCGRPVHQSASVPTPKADIPVPPPPQDGEQHRPRISLGKFVVGFLALIVELWLLIPTGGGSGSGGGNGGGGKKEVAAKSKQKHKDVQQARPEKKEQQPQEKSEKKEPPQAKPKPEYSVGHTANVANVTWKVSDAFLTNQLNSSFGTHKRGRFVVIDFTFTNNRNEEVTLDPDLHMILKDSQGREFGTDIDAYEYMPTDLDIFLEPVNPGVSKTGRVIYQVGADATGFTLTLDDVELMEDKSAVFDLGVLPARAYVDPSAGATASPGP